MCIADHKNGYRIEINTSQESKTGKGSFIFMRFTYEYERMVDEGTREKSIVEKSYRGLE